MTRRLRFHRDFTCPSGGHGKVWDYFSHADAHPGWLPSVYLTPGSIDLDNPWRENAVRVDTQWRPHAADALFLGGMDWQAYPADDPGRPVINLVQHVRHGDPAHPLHAFLSRRAVRLCVSSAVADAINATGRVNGPVRVIEAALAWPPEGMPVAASRAGIFIDAIKQPALGQALAAGLREQGRVVELCDQRLPRRTYLSRMAGAEIAVLLPHATEGFYLPGLEAMALGCAPIVPDCVGNRAYLVAEGNALSPPMQLEALKHAVGRLDEASLRARLTAAGRATETCFRLDRERQAFHALLDDLGKVWQA